MPNEREREREKKLATLEYATSIASVCVLHESNGIEIENKSYGIDFGYIEVSKLE